MGEEISHGITLQWKMSEASWDHWVRGLGQRTFDDVITNGLRDIKENGGKGKYIARWARNLAANNIPCRKETMHTEEMLPHEISVTVTSRLWHTAMNKVGSPDQEVRSANLLAAIILADESWSRSDDEQWRQGDAGWHQDDLVANLSSLSTRKMSREISLRHREICLLVWAVGGAVVSAVGTGILAIIEVWKALYP